MRVTIQIVLTEEQRTELNKLVRSGCTSVRLAQRAQTVLLAAAEKKNLPEPLPRGLAAAITLARAARSVILHEAQAEVGHRFKRDLQGVENWSTRQDVLTVLRTLGITTGFNQLPCRQGTAFDAWKRTYVVHSHEPLFYRVERGPGPGTPGTPRCCVRPLSWE